MVMGFIILFQAHLYEGYKYGGERTLDKLIEFVMSNINVNVHEISSLNWKKVEKQSWLLFLCLDKETCPENTTIKKLTASLVIIQQPQLTIVIVID